MNSIASTSKTKTTNTINSTSSSSNLNDVRLFEGHSEQRRIRNLNQIIIRNLSLNPNPTSTPYSTSTDNTSDTSTSTIRNTIGNESKGKGKGKRIESTSSTKYNSSESGSEFGSESELELGSINGNTSSGVGDKSRRRSTSVNTLDSIITIRASTSSNFDSTASTTSHQQQSEPDEISFRTAAGVREEEANRRCFFKSDQRIYNQNSIQKKLMREKLLDCFISLRLVSPFPTTFISTTPAPSLDSTRISSTTNLLPFFISPPSIAQLNPSFFIDPLDFLLPPSVSSSPFLYPESEGLIKDWKGLKEFKMVLSIWVRKGLELPDVESESEEVEDEWNLLRHVEVDFSDLEELGSESSNFPDLGSNAVIFNLNGSYYTAPTSSANTEASASSNEEEVEENLSNFSITENGEDNLSRNEKVRNKVRERVVIGDVTGSGSNAGRVKSADWDQIGQLFSLESDLDEVKDSIRLKYQSMDLILGDEGGLESLEREKNELEDRVNDYNTVHVSLVEDLLEYKEDLVTQRKILNQRRTRLKEVKELSDLNRIKQLAVEQDLVDQEIQIKKIQIQIKSLRTCLITLLSQIFPIEPSPTSTPSSMLFTINSLPLPNSPLPASLSSPSTTSYLSLYTSPEPEIYSCALGYIAQILILLSEYLRIPLIYPIKFSGSRSLIMDFISRMTGPRAFPIHWGEGTERWRVDYGVFLLGKDVELLMYSQNLLVPDLRNTLPNLKSLLLKLSFDTSHPEFKRSNLNLLTPPPGFQPITSSSSPSFYETSQYQQYQQTETEQPTNLSIQVLNPTFPSSSSSSSSSSGSNSSEFDSEEEYNVADDEEERRPELPPKFDSGAGSGSRKRSESLKSNKSDSSVRTITLKNSSGTSHNISNGKLGNNGNGVIEKLETEVGNGNGSTTKSSWRVGKLI